MKEEQNASSSANYDVELFHSASAHMRSSTFFFFFFFFFLKESKVKRITFLSVCRLLGEGCDLVQSMRDGCEYKTITLKWCTPRGSPASDMHHCTGAVRVTPTDVNSRPSSCLTNFLLAGEDPERERERMVALEMC